MLALTMCYIGFQIVQPTKVFIHVERFNKRYNLFHVGISFVSLHRTVRYDFRSFNDDGSYITTHEEDSQHIEELFENESSILKNFIDNSSDIYSKDYLWGETNKDLGEIISFEEKNLHKKYILGIYDCRHYVRNLTLWSCNNPTPIWKLINYID